MSTIGVYDYDFFHYSKCIPNLECAKLVSYYRQNNDIAILTPKMNFKPYTKVIVRKDYEDWEPNSFISEQNCEYGGRLFSPMKYMPLAPKEAEQIIPDMHIYSNYSFNFQPYYIKNPYLSRILNCIHFRLDAGDLSPSLDKIVHAFEKQKGTGLFLHDYNLSIKDHYEFLKNLSLECSKMSFIPKNRIVSIGTKFNAVAYSMEDLTLWSKLEKINKYFDIEIRKELTVDDLLFLKEMEFKDYNRPKYRIDYNCSNEEEFLMHRLPQIFKEVTFFKINGIQILLNYDNGFLVTPEVRDLIQLINNWCMKKFIPSYDPQRQTLYGFCYWFAQVRPVTGPNYITLTSEQMRNAFRYIYNHNYELFKIFYEQEIAKIEGGELVYGGLNNPSIH